MQNNSAYVYFYYTCYWCVMITVQYRHNKSDRIPEFENLVAFSGPWFTHLLLAF